MLFRSYQVVLIGLPLYGINLSPPKKARYRDLYRTLGIRWRNSSKGPYDLGSDGCFKSSEPCHRWIPIPHAKLSVNHKFWSFRWAESPSQIPMETRFASLVFLVVPIPHAHSLACSRRSMGHMYLRRMYPELLIGRLASFLLVMISRYLLLSRCTNARRRKTLTKAETSRRRSAVQFPFIFSVYGACVSYTTVARFRHHNCIGTRSLLLDCVLDTSHSHTTISAFGTFVTHWP